MNKPQESLELEIERKCKDTNNKLEVARIALRAANLIEEAERLEIVCDEHTANLVNQTSSSIFYQIIETERKAGRVAEDILLRFDSLFKIICAVTGAAYAVTRARSDAASAAYWKTQRERAERIEAEKVRRSAKRAARKLKTAK